MITYKLYGTLHKNVKSSISNLKGAINTVKYAYFYENINRDIWSDDTSKTAIINDEFLSSDSYSIPSSKLFYGENAIINTIIGGNLMEKPMKINEIIKYSEEEAWMKILNNSNVPAGFRNSGFHSTGYILEKEQYCLSSWIWTSAAIAHCYIVYNDIEKAKVIANAFLREQLLCGGWIVRYDFNNLNDVIPVVAPNDSAYIANNCLLSVYKATGEKTYLEGAVKCADWIIATAKDDGLVKLGYDNRSKEWNDDVNIVDIGFTGGLFAEIFSITKEQKYKDYLEKFSIAYIEAFFNYNIGCFSTSINKNYRQQGGFFGRGQGWALEGLIPAYCVLQNNDIKKVIDLNTSFLLNNQLRNGGWPYNFQKKLMGEDCKGIPILAKALLNWYEYSEEKNRIINSAQDALNWCKKHTKTTGNCIGGIFSYCVEGAVVHDFYTQTAFTYASAYALEVSKRLKELENDISK